MNKPIYVTQPSLPLLSEFIPYLERIWESKILTNNGEMHQQLETALAKYLGVSYVCLFNNGTSALITALQALDVRGEIITTPYSFVATSHAIKWNGLTPVFVDIDPETFNLDPDKIEDAITEQTTALLPVHCYGNPCNINAIDKIASKYKLKVLYDAAHAFGVQDESGSILRYGDLSVLSFHATKVFNTFEGGAIVCHTEAMKRKIDRLKNFGIANETEVLGMGVNGKMSEVNAAFGLLQLNYIDVELAKRAKIHAFYKEQLRGIDGISLLSIPLSIQYNCAYFPILVNTNYPLTRDELYQKLKDNNIFGRRYFYPLISNFEAYKALTSSQKENLPIANKIAEQVLCLPMYADLSLELASHIVEKIKDWVK